jgi:hypothetical protein
MGIFDRIRQADPSGERTYEGQRVALSEDEQALARYRYMLKTAPPETIEQAHVEAFARLTPEQRRMLLEQLRNEMPDAERAYAAADTPQALARMATRAEVRRPGTLEALFGRMPAAGQGFGGIMASSLLGSMAGTVLGTMIAQHFLADHAFAQSNLAEAPAGNDWQDADATHDGGDFAGGFDDVGGDLDPGTFDV